MEKDERELLIRVDTTVQNMHRELLGGEGQIGRIPKLEKTQDDHAASINKAKGSIGTLVWVLGGLGLLLGGLATALFAHVLGGK